MTVSPYVFFDGRCEEAMEFYRRALGAKIEMAMRFKESPQAVPNQAPEMGNKIMHATLRIGKSTIHASDGECGGAPKFGGFSLTLAAESDDEAKKYFAALSEGGTVKMPLTKTFFSSSFGMLADRFGVSWMVIVEN